MIKSSGDNVVEFGSSNFRKWADLINTAWQRTTAGILEAGRLLVEAKDNLEHGSFERMVRTELNFSESTATRLMQIANNPTLSNPAHGQLLPASWRSLVELEKAERKLGEGTIASWLESGKVTPRTERKEIVALVTPAKPDKPNGSEKRKRHPKPEFNSPEDTQHDRDLRALLGMWESACETARKEFLARIG